MKKYLILITMLGMFLLAFTIAGIAAATDYIYISPSGGSGTGWTNIPNSYDGVDSTSAISYNNAPNQWSEPLILTYDPVDTVAIKYLVTKSAYGTEINLDAYYEGTWHDVFQGAATWATWEEKNLDASHIVSQVRISFYGTGGSFDAIVYEEKWKTTTTVWPPSGLAEYNDYYGYSVNNTAFDWLDTPPDMPATLYTELNTSYIPGGSIIDEILGISDTPKALWWFPFMFIGICICGLLVYDATQRTGGEGSLLTMCICIEALLLAFGLLGMADVVSIIPLWPALLFPIPATALVLSRRHVGWG